MMSTSPLEKVTPWRVIIALDLVQVERAGSSCTWTPMSHDKMCQITAQCVQFHHLQCGKIQGQAFHCTVYLVIQSDAAYSTTKCCRLKQTQYKHSKEETKRRQYHYFLLLYTLAIECCLIFSLWHFPLPSKRKMSELKKLDRIIQGMGFDLVT